MKKRAITAGMIGLLVAGVAKADLILVPTHYPDIQTAVDSSTPGDTILLSQGLYAENVTIGSHGLLVASQWIINQDTTAIDSTILVGDTSASWQRPFTITTPLGELVRISGLTLRDGDSGETGQGGALQAHHATLQLAHLHFVDNDAENGGAAYFSESSVDIRDCFFTGNHGSGHTGALFGYQSSLQLVGNTFENNSSDHHSAVLAWNGVDGTGVVTGNRIISNVSHFIYGTVTLWGGGNWRIEDNLFENNLANEGGGVHTYSIDTLGVINNRFISNTVEMTMEGSDDWWGGQGGACVLYADQYDLIRGNLFESNHAEAEGGVIVNGSNVSAHHNQFVGNTAGNYAVLYSVTDDIPHMTFYRNLVQGNYGTTSPRFDSSYQGAMRTTIQGVLTVYENDFLNNQTVTIDHILESTESAVNNYWGDPSGPYQEELNPGGEGDTLDVAIPFQPFSRAPFIPPRLDCTESSHDFGIVPADSASRWHLGISNLGTDSLVGELDLGQTSPFRIEGPEAFTLGESDSADVLLVFHPLNTAFVEDTLWIESNDPRNPRIPVLLSGGDPASEVKRGSGADRPESFVLLPPHPNPTNGQLSLEMQLPHDGTLEIDVFNLLGETVESITAGYKAKGRRTFSFTIDTLPSGIYFLRVTFAQQDVYIRKLVLLR